MINNDLLEIKDKEITALRDLIVSLQAIIDSLIEKSEDGDEDEEDGHKKRGR
jgi:hypothetical protein